MGRAGGHGLMAAAGRHQSPDAEHRGDSLPVAAATGALLVQLRAVLRK